MAPLQFLALLVLGAGILGILGISGISGIPAVPAPGSSPEEQQPGSQSPAPLSWLRWFPFRGRLPPDAVCSRSRSGRAQFVCSTRARGCNLGSFEPLRGPFCFFPWAGRELNSSDFQLLLNPGAFEALRWVPASFGRVPPGAVEGCPLSDLFVGRSPAGLGKLSKEHQALFVAQEGEELWYKWYEVLVVRQDAAELSLDELSYNISAALESAEPALLAEQRATNSACGATNISFSLREATELEHSWTAELPALAAARGMLRAAPLVLKEPAGWQLGETLSVPWLGSASASQFVSRSQRAVLEVPARSECSAVLRGVRREIRVPFRARLSRGFRSGPPHRLPVAGWARSRAFSGGHIALEGCRPLAELAPCPR